MNITSKKKKLITISSISIIILIFFILFIIKPVMLKLESLSETILEKKTELESLIQKETILPKQEKEFENLKDKMSKILNTIPTQDETINFIMDLEQIAHKNNIIQSINIKEEIVKPEKEGNKLKRVVFEINLTGGFADITNYIVNLENLEYYADINSLNISQAVTTKITPQEGLIKLKPGTVNTNLDVVLYVKE